MTMFVGAAAALSAQLSVGPVRAQVNGSVLFSSSTNPATRASVRFGFNSTMSASNYSLNLNSSNTAAVDKWCVLASQPFVCDSNGLRSAA